jgi:HlyD family secretion protein
MADPQNNNLFRKEALERSSSPEQLDQMMQVVSPKKWLPLAALGTLVAAGLGWSVFGRIPITVNGQGVLVYPSKVLDFQASTSGQIQNVNVRVGDTVKKGDIIATYGQGDLKKQLELARNKLADLETQNRNSSSMQQRRGDLDKRSIEQQRIALQQSLQATQSVTPILKEKGIESIKSDRANLEDRLKTTQELLPTFKQRWEARQRLFQAGGASNDQVLAARQEYLNEQNKLNEVKSQLKALDVREADAEREYLQNLNRVKEIQAQLRQLDTQAATQDQQDLESTTNRQKEIQETKRTIAQLQSQLTGKSQLKSPYTGKILELAVSPGQMVTEGVRLGSIDEQKSDNNLVSFAFLPVSDGKKIQKGMEVQITPSTVKREQFGGIVGKVTDVSAFPITKEGASRLIGNPEIVQSLMAQGPQVQISSELKPDKSTFSGYQWSSSKGPNQKMSPGTTTSVRVTVEEQAPITFVLPILKSWTGVY